jgi:Holliday junction resolvase
MPNANYLAGRRFEYEIVELFKARGYEATRTAGSHGTYDVVARDPKRPVEFIQCKRVESSTVGKRLLDKFRATTVPSQYFHQTLAVKVKGTKAPSLVTV